MHNDAIRILQELRDDFTFAAPTLLKIKGKTGKIIPFHLNEAQTIAHNALEKQRRETGVVRAVILKGRQQGLSTYIGARFFHRTILTPGIKTFILTHEQAATDNLFDMVTRYLEHFPKPMLPQLGAANAKELAFAELDSGYKVATAGNKGAGRSSTAQLLHGSEAAFWPAAKEHIAGIMQAIPREPGTEIILESTANGVGNVYHETWEKGMRNEGGWQSIFIPWYVQREYRMPLDGVELSTEDKEYGKLYGLDPHQIAWRRYKINEMSDERLFCREYPSTPAEAFAISSADSFIPSSLVSRARKDIANPQGPRVLGVDPARFGEDRTVIYVRQGRVAERVMSVQGKDLMEVAGLVAMTIDKYNPRATNIDVGGIGAGVVDRLRELGYKVNAINFGESPLSKDRYKNKRAEMWDGLKQWLMEPPVQIPDDDKLEVDLCGIKFSYDSLQRLQLERKEDAKRRGISSPDDADALALTFAVPIGSMENSDEFVRMRPHRPAVAGMGY